MFNPFNRKPKYSTRKGTNHDEVEELVKRVIRDDLGQLVGEVIEANMKPINALVEQMQGTQDIMVKQVNEDRKDISALKTSHATIIAQQKTIIDNQNHSEDKVVEAVQVEVKKIPKATEKAVEKMFDKKPFLARIKSKFGKKEEVKK